MTYRGLKKTECLEVVSALIFSLHLLVNELKDFQVEVDELEKSWLYH